VAVFTLEAVLSLATEKYDKSLNEAGGKLKSFGDTLSKGLGVAAKATAAAIAAGATAAAALTKQAVQAYADYEQLVGGIKKLYTTSTSAADDFKKSIEGSTDAIKKFQAENKLAVDGIIGPQTTAAIEKAFDGVTKTSNEAAKLVQHNAEQAYKTVGMSSIEYMNSVMGISASLIKSFDGDAVAAAKAADKAMRDIADNANTFGKFSVDELTNVYQALARGMYTTLDNLQLGYAGTKEGMQQLIQDANKLREAQGETADLTIDKYGDIVEAIHLVQKEMKITGTTEKEAASTITGSLNMAKSAWKNLVLGMADENADMDKLVDNFVDSADAVATNLTPRIERALKGAGTLVKKLAPKAGQLLSEIIPEVLPSLISGGTGLISSVVGVLAENAPEIIGQLTSALLENKDAIWEAIRALFKGGKEVLNGIGEELGEDFPLLGFIFDDLGDKITGVVTAILTLKGVMTAADWINTVSQAVQGLSGAFSNMGSAASGAGQAAGAIGGAGGISTLGAAGLAVGGVALAYGQYQAHKEDVDYILSGGFGELREQRSAADQQRWDTYANLISSAGLEASVENIQKVYNADDITALGYSMQELASMIQANKGPIDSAMTTISEAAESMSDSFEQSTDTAGESVDEMAESAADAVEQMSEAISEGSDSVTESVTVMADAVGAVMEALAASGYGYGSDFIGGLLSGFNSRKAEFVASAESLAGDVRAMLHFSRPDEGPLADYETWMPDFMEGLAKGIEDNSYKVHDALDDALGYASSAMGDGGMTINHTGTIRLEGVNSDGEMTAVSEVVYEGLVARLRQEARYV